MGKRYLCDYCDKTMVATPAIVKTHNNGLAHQKLVQEHYQQFKDPEKILQEESKKNPCQRFPTGRCQFGAICRYSHYSREELNALRKYVTSRNIAKLNKLPPSIQDLYQKLKDEKKKPYQSCSSSEDQNTILYDSNGVTHVFPWIYNSVMENYGENLPPSLKRMKIEDFENANITEWG